MSQSATPATRNEATRRLKPPKRPFCRTYHRHGHIAIARTLANGCGRLRTVANGCKPLRTVADGCGRKRNLEQTHPQPPDPQSETGTIATHSGKRKEIAKWTHWHERRGKWTGWKRWNDWEEVTNGREELKLRKERRIGNRREELKSWNEREEVAKGITKSWNETKEVRNEREELQRKDGRNEMVKLKGKEEQEEQDRRFERKDGPNQMNAFKWKEEVDE